MTINSQLIVNIPGSDWVILDCNFKGKKILQHSSFIFNMHIFIVEEHHGLFGLVVLFIWLMVWFPGQRFLGGAEGSAGVACRHLQQ